MTTSIQFVLSHEEIYKQKVTKRYLISVLLRDTDLFYMKYYTGVT